MKKLKIILVSLAIFTAIGTAWANKCALYEYYVQYYNFNGVYMQAGQMGVNYVCLDEAGYCTYYKPTPFSNFYTMRGGQLLSTSLTKRSILPIAHFAGNH